MKVLVTGGAGYIDSHLMGALRQAGHMVRMLDLRPASGEHLTDPGCDFVRGSVANAILAAQAVQDVTAVTCATRYGVFCVRTTPTIWHLPTPTSKATDRVVQDEII